MQQVVAFSKSSFIATNNPYGCPPEIYRAMMTAESWLLATMPLLRAVKKLGPRKVRWLGTAKYQRVCIAVSRTLSAWSLDGRVHATHGELLRAAGVNDPFETRAVQARTK